MTYTVKESKILFLDSRAGIQNKGKTRINFPSESFSAKGNQVIRLTLLELNLKRTFYNINSTNNLFYLYESIANETYPLVLREGNYDLDGIATEIQTQINAIAGIDTVVVSVEPNTDRFVINVSTEADIGPNSYFYTLKEKDNKNYSTHEILGGLPSDVSTPANKVVKVFNFAENKFTSKYPAQTQTINNIFLKATLQTSNFETNLSLNDDQKSFVVNSQKFATIEVPESSSDKNITFRDSNNTYEMYIQTKHLTSINFDIEDEQNRSLPVIDSDQYPSGNLHYNMVVKFEILEPDTPTPLLGEFRGNYKNATSI